MNQLYKLRISIGLEYEGVGDLSQGIKINDKAVVKCEKYTDFATVVDIVGEPFEDLEAFERQRAMQNKGRHVEGQRLPQILRVATEADLAQAALNDKDARIAHNQTMERIKVHGLEMKLIFTHYAFDRKLIIFQFSADGRIDFRELLRDLSGLFKVRVELRQVGVRDEASILGGVGTCGRPFCCAAFLSSFNSINVKMAKQQGLSLNPQNISGCCGRLKCCLQFEADSYREMEDDNTRCQGCQACKSEQDAQPEDSSEDSVDKAIPEDAFDDGGTIVAAQQISVPAAAGGASDEPRPAMSRQQHQQEKRREHQQAMANASQNGNDQQHSANRHGNRLMRNPVKKPLPPVEAEGKNSLPHDNASNGHSNDRNSNGNHQRNERRHGHNKDHNHGPAAAQHPNGHQPSADAQHRNAQGGKQAN